MSERSGKPPIDIRVQESPDDAVRVALEMWRDGAPVVSVHRRTVDSAESVATALRKVDGVNVRLSPPSESPEDLVHAMRTEGRCIHVYCEEVCDRCEGLSQSAHYYRIAGLFSRICDLCAAEFLPGM